MRIVNNYDFRGVFDVKLKVFWRAFEAWDDGHVIGVREGLLGYGESADFSDPRFFQLEFKKENVMGEFLAKAGPIFSRGGGDVALNSDGSSVSQDAPAWNRYETSEWMDNDRIQNKTLFDITLPCTHDSGAYWLGPRLFVDNHASDPFVNDTLVWALNFGKTWVRPVADVIEEIVRPICIAQSRPIDQQLNEGIRVIDLRVVTVNGGFNTGHGLIGMPISVILQQVNQFLEKTKRELVVVVLGTGNSTDDSGKNRLYELVKKTFGDRLVFKNHDWRKTKLRDITNSGSRVVVMGIPGPPDGPGLGGRWINTDDPTKLETEIVKDVKHAQSADAQVGDWAGASWTLTAQFDRLTKPLEPILERIRNDAMFAALSPAVIALMGVELGKILELLKTTLPMMEVDQLAAKVNPLLKGCIEGVLAKDRINSIWVDFYENTPVVELAAKRSAR